MKLKGLILNNYRGYRYQEFSFVDGLNTFIGTGDSGKSAIIKAISFVTENNQSGNVIGNHIKEQKLNKDGSPQLTENGDPVYGDILKGESCYVILLLDDDTRIKRERKRVGAKFNNIYQINDNEPIQNFGQGVPDDVLKLLNMNEVNVQSQFESHFMLKDNPPTNAKTLNRMAHLEIIDESTSNMSSIVRKIKKNKDASDTNLKKYTVEVAKFDFLENMEKDVSELVELEKQMDMESVGYTTLGTVISYIKEWEAELKVVEDMTKHSDLVTEVLSLYKDLDNEKSEHSSLDTIGEGIFNGEETLEQINNIIKNETLASDLISLFETKSGRVTEYNKLLDCVESIEEYEKELKTYTDVSKYKESVAEILSLYDELVILQKRHKILDGHCVNICDWEDDVMDCAESIKKDFEKIKDEACSTCGNSLRKLEEVC